MLNKYGVEIGIYANNFVPISSEWELDATDHTETRTDINPEIYYNKFVKKWVSKYMDILGMIGGCCEINDEYIAYMYRNITNDFPNIILTPHGNTKFLSKL